MTPTRNSELFKHDIVVRPIIYACFDHLFGDDDDDDDDDEDGDGDADAWVHSMDDVEVTTLCDLFTNVGAKLEKDDAASTTMLNEYAHKFARILKVRGKTLAAKARFALQDALELRRRKWRPRQEKLTAKTIAEIHRDDAKQQQQQHRGNGGGRGGGGGGGGRGGRSGGGGGGGRHGGGGGGGGRNGGVGGFGGGGGGGGGGRDRRR
jgi:hypothetical protein